MSVVVKEAGSDPLSSLPDAVIITHILPKLPVKEMVQTCVLSKKWRHLWTFVPSLKFKDWYPHGRFEDFVTQFLLRRDDSTALGTFTLRDYDPNCASVTRWILYALNHSPKKLKIILILSGDDCVHVPGCFFTCKSLECVDLALFRDGQGDKQRIEPDIVCLPKLTNLSLKDLSLGGDCMEKITNGCPALEDLLLEFCTLEMETISFPNVKKLAISSCRLPESLAISGPVVEDLRFVGPVGPGTKLLDMDNVTKFYMKEEYHYIQLLNGVASVEDLHIFSLCLAFRLMKGELDGCRVFHNLKKLKLGRGCVNCCSHMLPSFLSHCPNLEDLTIQHSPRQCGRWDTVKEVQIGCFGCQHLKKINVIYGDYLHLDRLVLFFARCASAIPHVQIILTKM